MPAHPDHRGTERLRLLARVRRRFDVVHRVHTVGPLQVPFYQVLDPDRVLDDVAAEEDRRERLTGQRKPGEELHLPYWAELWDSAFGVGAFLVHDQHDRRRRFGATDTLDLGCGQGLAGAVAATLGHRVLLADLETDALLFARLNTLRFAGRAEVRRVDWRRDRLGRRFDLILGADVLYDRSQWAYLEPFWREHLKSDGFVLLGEPGRQTGDLFPQWLADKGWRLERFEEPVPTRPRPIRLLRLMMDQ